MDLAAHTVEATAEILVFFFKNGLWERGTDVINIDGSGVSVVKETNYEKWIGLFESRMAGLGEHFCSGANIEAVEHSRCIYIDTQKFPEL